ncbi:LCP family protein [Streptomyces megasporus]|uniref:LCP family protein n=1 Tax=Streptomyces megasporus TaxID=44060 RepID=UPI003CCB7E0D
MDPADQWVFDPDTGDYRLRLPSSGAQATSAPPSPSVSAPSGSSSPRAGGSRATGTRAAGSRSAGSRASGSRASGSRAADRGTATPRGEVPRQRRRRAAESPSAGGGAAGGDGPKAGRQTGRRKPKPKKDRKKKALLWTGGVTAFLVVGTSAAAYIAYEHFDGNLSTVDVGNAGNGGFGEGGPINILLIGTDKRTGKGNEGYGDSGSGGHADTTFLFHVSEDRTNATVLSIPRDLITDIPDCPTKQADGSTEIIPGTPSTRFNNSLGQEGRDPGCTMRTVKELTGLDVHHFMMADFNAVKTLTTAIDGVDVCLEKPVKDPKSKLDLPAGVSTVMGEDALAFVRTRNSFGNSSDLDRIKVQQQFLSSMIRKLKSNDTLTDPGKLWDLADAVTKALTVDTGIGTIKKLTQLGQEISGINTKNISFVTLPVNDNPAERVKATVVLDEAKARPLFSMLQNDVSLTEVEKKEKAAKDKAKKEQEALLKGERAAASDVRVEVLNGGEIAGAAQATLSWLQNSQGVPKSSNGGNAPSRIAETTLEFAPNQADQARKLADIMGLPASALKQGTEDAEPLEPMTLTLGADFKGAGIPIAAPTKPPEDLGNVEADKQICAK